VFRNKVLRSIFGNKNKRMEVGKAIADKIKLMAR
jgi:hypothetical protein